MKKILLGISVLVASISIGTRGAFADEKEVIYDLETHQSTELFELEENGELINIMIAEDPSLLRMANKTYTITKSKANSWTISYKVTVKSNKIVSAYGGNFKAIQGVFSNTSVNKSSNSAAIGKGSWKYRAVTCKIQLKVSIVNNNLQIT
jgi:hypothetical protein